MVVSLCNFNLHFLKISNAEHIFMCFLGICRSSLEKQLPKSFARLLLRFFSRSPMTFAEKSHSRAYLLIKYMICRSCLLRHELPSLSVSSKGNSDVQQTLNVPEAIGPSRSKPGVNSRLPEITRLTIRGK